MSIKTEYRARIVFDDGRRVEVSPAPGNGWPTIDEARARGRELADLCVAASGKPAGYRVWIDRRVVTRSRWRPAGS